MKGKTVRNGPYIRREGKLPSGDQYMVERYGNYSHANVVKKSPPLGGTKIVRRDRIEGKTSITKKDTAHQGYGIKPIVKKTTVKRAKRSKMTY